MTDAVEPTVIHSSSTGSGAETGGNPAGEQTRDAARHPAERVARGTAALPDGPKAA